MADKPGPPQKLQDTKSFQITVPKSMHGYIQWLARHTMWGPTERDVVVKILTQELNRMFDAGYHNKRLPGEDS
jgi:hypothetical protein